jgi:hypothetical protein
VIAIEVRMRGSLLWGYSRAWVKQLLLVAVAFAVAVSGTAHASVPFVYDRELGNVARESLWRADDNGPRVARSDVKRVDVRCYRDRWSFERVFERRFGLPAGRVIAYYAGGGDVYMRNGTCQNIRAFLLGRHTVYTAAAYSILLHESLHRQGLKSERITTCMANDAVRWGALWLGFDDEQALRARNLAFTYSRLFAPPDYFIGKPTCLALARRTDWIDHVRRGR